MVSVSRRILDDSLKMRMNDDSAFTCSANTIEIATRTAQDATMSVPRRIVKRCSASSARVEMK